VPIFLYFYYSIQLFKCLSANLSILSCLFRMSVCLSMHLSFHLSVYLSAFLSVCTSISLSVHLLIILSQFVLTSVYSTLHSFIRPTCPSVHPSVHLSVLYSNCRYNCKVPYQDKSVTRFCHQVALWVPDIFCNFYFVLSHEIANNSATTEAREIISTYLQSMYLYIFIMCV
jgi:hypothetical protein